jgi:hypothetical protein
MKIREVAQWCSVLLSLAAVAFCFGCSSPSQAQSTTPSSQVLVVNSASQAVPVAAQGTASVSITNTTAIPVIPQGTANVNIANPAVPILPTFAQDSFFATGFCRWSNASECQTLSPVLLAVPANQTAVLQSISGFCQLDSGAQIVYYQLTNEANANGNFFLPSSPTTPYNSGSATSFHENVTTYLHGGTSGVNVILDVFASTGQTGAADSCTVYASGYMVPVP